MKKLDIDFTEGDKKLTPVILSHSLKWNRNALVSIIYYLVSYGCIVYAPTHTDESANYFKDYTSDPPKDVFFHGYDKEKDGPNKHEFYLKQLKHRMIDIKIILDLIISESKSTIPAIDLSKLTALGHSLGGITAIEACNQFSSHFKLWIALDPLFSPRFKQIKEIGDYRIDQPIILINSEDFHNSLVHQEYNSKEIHDKFVKCQKEYSKNKVYNVYIKNCYHINQWDYSLVNTHLLMFMGQLPKSVDPKDKYKECIGKSYFNSLYRCDISFHGWKQLCANKLRQTSKESCNNWRVIDVMEFIFASKYLKIYFWSQGIRRQLI